MPAYPSLRQLQCFHAVAEERNFRRAAERLHMSQPPLSRQVQALEDRLGVQLLDRSSHYVDLTAAGTRLLAYARTVLAAYDELVAAAGTLADAAVQRLRIGLTQVIDPAALPDLARSLDGLVAGEGVEERHGVSRRLLADVRAGRLDLALVAAPAEVPDDLTALTAGSETLIAALPAGHPAAARDALHLRDLEGLPLFWFRRSENPVLYDRVQAAFTRAGGRPATRPKPGDRQALLNNVAEGQGFALVPASTQAVRRPGVVYRGFAGGVADDLRLDLCLAHRTSEARPVVLEAARRLAAALTSTGRHAAAAE
jgi:DNA-binding transcriptional LysR family regulator